MAPPRPPRDPNRPSKGTKPTRGGDATDKRTKSPSAAARDARRAQQHAATQPTRPPAKRVEAPRATPAPDLRRPGSAARTNASGRVTKPKSPGAATQVRRPPIERADRADRPARPFQADRPTHADRTSQSDRPVRSDRPARPDRAAADRASYVDRPARSARSTFPDRPAGAGRSAPGQRGEQGTPSGRPFADRPQRGGTDRGGTDRGGAPAAGRTADNRGDRPQRAAFTPGGQRPPRAPFGARPDRASPDRQPGRPDRPERGERPAFATRADRHAASARPAREDAPRRGAARHERIPAAPRAAPIGVPGEGQRIAKLLARAGVASRREIERMIVEGRVAIAGVAIDTAATILKSLVGVTVDGNPVQAAAPARLFRYHKPAGLLTAERDPAGRATIYDRLPAGLPRVIPVGRLDLNTEGLLLLTTDGELKRQLELPATGVERTYRARVFGDVTQTQLEELIDGVEIEGIRYGQIDANLERRTGRNGWLEMRLREGKNREVRRVLEFLGLQVSRLIRTSYGPFALEDMPPGEVDEIRQHDLVAFRKSLK